MTAGNMLAELNKSVNKLVRVKLSVIEEKFWLKLAQWTYANLDFC